MRTLYYGEIEKFIAKKPSDVEFASFLYSLGRIDLGKFSYNIDYKYEKIKIHRKLNESMFIFAKNERNDWQSVCCGDFISAIREEYPALASAIIFRANLFV